jgi:hypothetical protein
MKSINSKKIIILNFLTYALKIHVNNNRPSNQIQLMVKANINLFLFKHIVSCFFFYNKIYDNYLISIMTHFFIVNFVNNFISKLDFPHLIDPPKPLAHDTIVSMLHMILAHHQWDRQ